MLAGVACVQNATLRFTASKNVALSASAITAQQLAKPTNRPALAGTMFRCLNQQELFELSGSELTSLHCNCLKEPPDLWLNVFYLPFSCPIE